MARASASLMVRRSIIWIFMCNRGRLRNGKGERIVMARLLTRNWSFVMSDDTNVRLQKQSRREFVRLGFGAGAAGLAVGASGNVLFAKETTAHAGRREPLIQAGDTIVF